MWVTHYTAFSASHLIYAVKYLGILGIFAGFKHCNKSNVDSYCYTLYGHPVYDKLLIAKKWAFRDATKAMPRNGLGIAFVASIKAQ